VFPLLALGLSLALPVRRDRDPTTAANPTRTPDSSRVGSRLA
jgi:hypothetical protein